MSFLVSIAGSEGGKFAGAQSQSGFVELCRQEGCGLESDYSLRLTASPYPYGSETMQPPISGPIHIAVPH